MKIEYQVVNISLSEEMKEHDSPQTAYFTWCRCCDDLKVSFEALTEREIKYLKQYFHVEPVCSAYTNPEIDELLPLESRPGREIMNWDERMIDAKAKTWIRLRRKGWL